MRARAGFGPGGTVSTAPLPLQGAPRRPSCRLLEGRRVVRGTLWTVERCTAAAGPGERCSVRPTAVVPAWACGAGRWRAGARAGRGRCGRGRCPGCVPAPAVVWAFGLCPPGLLPGFRGRPAWWWGGGDVGAAGAGAVAAAVGDAQQARAAREVVEVGELAHDFGAQPAGGGDLAGVLGVRHPRPQQLLGGGAADQVGLAGPAGLGGGELFEEVRHLLEDQRHPGAVVGGVPGQVGAGLTAASPPGSSRAPWRRSRGRPRHRDRRRPRPAGPSPRPATPAGRTLPTPACPGCPRPPCGPVTRGRCRSRGISSPGRGREPGTGARKAGPCGNLSTE